MGLFNLDFEKLYDELSSKEEYIMGMFCIQYPIYCIHSIILDSTKDSLDSLDNVIVEFLMAKPDCSALTLAALLGSSKALIEVRLKKLVFDGLLTVENDKHLLTPLGIDVFQQKVLTRQHKKSYDFYIDGITLKALPKTFYNFYSSKYLNESDSYYHTNAAGKTNLIKPFGPDIVHTPLHKSKIVEELLSIDLIDRDEMNIPPGLVEIEDISFSKLSLQLLVNVTKKDGNLKKELIDGFPFYLLSENISYYESTRKNIRLFEKNIVDKIQNLQFKIIAGKQREDAIGSPRPILTSNWQEIDRHKESANKCFSFSNDDLLTVIEKIFKIKNVNIENILNNDNEISIDINKEMLLSSTDKSKLILSIIRKRDYEWGNVDNNVCLLFLYYKTTDPFVKRVVHLKEVLKKERRDTLEIDDFLTRYPEFKDYFRECMVAAGEYDTLEKLDIKKFMLAI